MTTARRIVAAVVDGATTAKEIAAVLDMDEHLVSSHCCSLVKTGRLLHAGSLRYPRSSRWSWKFQAAPVQPAAFRQTYARTAPAAEA